MSQEFRGQRITIAGLGHFGGGIAVARWMVAQGATVLVTDRAPATKLADALAQLDGLPIEFRLGGHDERDFTSADLIVASPAIPPTNPYLQAAGAAGVPMSFGVLTTNSAEEALERAQPGPTNKGYEAAQAAVEMATLLRVIDRGPAA